MSSADAPLPTMPQPGTLLDGKYRLVRQLGAGGMGLVFEADHVRLRQPFAVKVLQPVLAQHPEFLGRFEREARAAALLRSPHVVRVFDVDVSNDGLTYIVMELLEGRDLAVEAGEGPVAVKDLADWMIQSCAALQEAHDQGIVHRDLKPANIFLARIENGERIAKVVDFGISKVEATSTNVLSVRDGTALGTPTFMSPEQIRGRRVDGRTDLWALGVIMYRILGGRWPFNGKTDQEYMSAVLADPPLPLEIVKPELPFELSSVIMKALEKDVASRHASASALAAALAPFGSGRGALVPLTSMPAPAMSRSSARAVETSSPRAVVIPAGSAETRSDRAGYLDTVVDRPPTPAVDKTAPLGVAAASPPAVFVPPTPVHTGPVGPSGPVGPMNAQTPSASPSPAPSGAVVAIAAALAAAIGFGAYMIATRRSEPSIPAAPASAATSTSAPSASLSASAVDPAIASAQPAPTGVTSAEPPPSATAKKRHRAPHGSASAGPESAPPASAPPAIPDHL